VRRVVRMEGAGQSKTRRGLRGKERRGKGGWRREEI
jgi:hypothetical protein